MPSSSRVIVANDYSFDSYAFGMMPFEYALWHNRKALGWGNVLFVDGHVNYLQATYNNPDFQNGRTGRSSTIADCT